MDVELNFHQLRLFCAVARLGSISKAAEQLNISQPSVSAQVREFEQRCGVELLHRLARGVALTDAGRLVFGHAERLFSQAGELQSLLQSLRGVQTGRLTVGGSLTAGEYFLPTVAGIFRARRPGVELTVILENSAVILARIAQGELDFGFVGTGSVGGNLTAIHCWQDEVVIIASPASLSTIRDSPTVELLQSQSFVIREPGSATRQSVEQCLRRHGVTVKPAMTVSSPEALKRHVAAGVGWGFASRCSVSMEVAAGLLAIAPIEGWNCRRAFCAVHRNDHRLSRSQQEFIEIARSRDVVPAPYPG
jgi:DNA-binding transcriptional LysR family regulator